MCINFAKCFLRKLKEPPRYLYSFVRRYGEVKSWSGGKDCVSVSVRVDGVELFLERIRTQIYVINGKCEFMSAVSSRSNNTSPTSIKSIKPPPDQFPSFFKVGESRPSLKISFYRSLILRSMQLHNPSIVRRKQQLDSWFRVNGFNLDWRNTIFLL